MAKKKLKITELCRKIKREKKLSFFSNIIKRQEKKKSFLATITGAYKPRPPFGFLWWSHAINQTRFKIFGGPHEVNKKLARDMTPSGLIICCRWPMRYQSVLFYKNSMTPVLERQAAESFIFKAFFSFSRTISRFMGHFFVGWKPKENFLTTFLLLEISFYKLVSEDL